MTPSRLRLSGDRGMATIWTVVVAGACVLVVGLVLDGGTVLRARNSTADLAAGAARAGAQELDQNALSLGQARLDPAEAARAAQAWLAEREAAGSVEVAEDTVTVNVHAEVPLQLLRPTNVTVTETATARAHHGRPSAP